MPQDTQDSINELSASIQAVIERTQKTFAADRARALVITKLEEAQLWALKLAK